MCPDPSLHRSRPRTGRRRALGLLAVLLVASACRVDTEVTLELDRDGSGTVTVVAVADAELVAAAPDLAADVRTDDLAAAGWEVEGPSPTADGGLQVTVRRAVADPTEAAAVLAQLSGPDGPFLDLEVVRVASRTRISTELTGTVLVPSPGVFADADLSVAIGGVPYQQLLADQGTSLSQAFGLTFRAVLPGELEDTTGVASPYDETTERTTIVWTAALDGSAATPPGQPLLARTALDDDGARRAQQLRDFAIWALPAWIVFFLFVVLPVVYLRRRRRA